MTTLREAAQQALEAMENAHNLLPGMYDKRIVGIKQRHFNAITALRAALAQEEHGRSDGMPASGDERYLRRLLAARVGIPGTYYDDGEAHGAQHGISIDFMREPVADIDAKLRALNVARAALAQQEPVAWISVTDALPKSGVTVLACYRNRLGKLRRIRAHWIAAKTVEANTEDWDQCSEYDEATDTYYVTEGWFECIDNWGDYSAVAVSEGDVTHWMPLPEAPRKEEA